MFEPTLVEEKPLCQMPAVVLLSWCHNEAGTWIGAVVLGKGLSIDPQACLYDNCRGA